MAHYTDRNHFFRDENDDRTHVITTQAGDHAFIAYLIEHPTVTDNLVACGDTRLDAIAKLQLEVEAWEREHS